MKLDREEINMPKTFYITTPLYYVNAAPHIGHSYTNVAADALARFGRLIGNEVFLLTGTDEYGEKIEEASAAQGLSPKEFADGVVERFKELWRVLGISYDDFIRTTEERHKKTVEKILSLLYEKGDIYSGKYEGWFCTPCESFWTDGQVKDGKCPDCNREVERIEEDNYFFRLSKYQDWLMGYIAEHPDFILPEIRRNEILGFLKNNKLEDLCISRPVERMNWGIILPFDKRFVTYVWFDALINYISACGYAENDDIKNLWPADVHIIGKDILRQHTVYWPIMLHALGLEIPKRVFAHGWWMIDKEKMSKSKGNIVDPFEMVEKYGVDVYRYFLLREVAFGADGIFSEEAIILRFNGDLANDLGNLLHRTLTMVEKYFEGVVPEPGEVEKIDERFSDKAAVLPNEIKDAMANLGFSSALISIWEFIGIANKYIEDTAPWTLNKAGNQRRLASVIYNLVEVLRITAIAVSPFMPQTAKKMWGQLGFGDFNKVKFEDMKWGKTSPGIKVNKGAPLFPRIEYADK